MIRKAHPLTSYTVRAAVAHFLALPTPSVELRHAFAGDLGMDAFDLAVVAAQVGEALCVDVRLRGIDETHTVGDLAERVERAILLDDVRRTATRRRVA